MPVDSPGGTGGPLPLLAGTTQTSDFLSQIAFVTETHSVRAILKHIGEPTSPPAISPARGPPAWEEAPLDLDLDLDLDCDPIAHPEPQIVFDQRVQW